MFRDISFGQYYPADSVVHRLNPCTKLMLTVVFIVALFFVPASVTEGGGSGFYGYFGYMLTLAVLIVTILAARVPIFSILRSIKAIAFIIILTVVLNLFIVDTGEYLWSWKALHITEDAVNTSIKLGLRLVLLIIGASVLPLTTTPVAIADGLETLMKPLKLIRVPVHDIAVVMSIALRFIPTLFEETQKIISAQKARGADFDTGSIFARAKSLLPVLIPLFVSSFRRADELAFAMDARCYNATENRTKMRKATFGFGDVAAILFILGYFTVILLDRYYLDFAVDKMIFGGLI